MEVLKCTHSVLIFVLNAHTVCAKESCQIFKLKLLFISAERILPVWGATCKVHLGCCIAVTTAINMCARGEVSLPPFNTSDTLVTGMDFSNHLTAL